MSIINKLLKRKKKVTKKVTEKIVQKNVIEKKHQYILDILNKNRKKIKLQNYSGNCGFIHEGKIYFIRKEPNGSIHVTVKKNGVTEAQVKFSYCESKKNTGF